MMKENQRKAIRVDLQFIARMIEPGSRLLDVGCGRGALLEYLVNEKPVDGRGIELSTEGVNACVIRGLSVIQGDANTDLKNYPDDAFDYVVLSQTLQAMTAPKEALEQMLRIGKRAIVSFPNFAHWRIRLHLLLKGRMPVSETLPDQWYDTPNIHFCTIKDFTELCREMGITAERAMALSQGADSVQRIDLSPLLSNLMGEQALFLLKK